MTAAIHVFTPRHDPLIASAYRILESDDATTIQRLAACDVLEQAGGANDRWTAGQIRIALAPQVLREANREMAADILAERQRWRAMIAAAFLAGLALAALIQWGPLS